MHGSAQPRRVDPRALRPGDTRSAARRFLQLPEKDLKRFHCLVREADRVELKVLVPEPAFETTCAVLGVTAHRTRARRVYYLDTPDLALHRRGVVVRVRSIDGRPDDSVVKLRPVNPSRIPTPLRRSKGFVVEIDGMPGSYVCSGALKRQLGAHDVERAVAGRRPLRVLFSARQLALLAHYAPAHLRLDDLSVLGPVEVGRCRLSPRGLGVALTVERWTYPDGSQLLELSTRCPAAAVSRVAAQTTALLRAYGIRPAAVQGMKTDATLSYFRPGADGLSARTRRGRVHSSPPQA